LREGGHLILVGGQTSMLGKFPHLSTCAVGVMVPVSDHLIWFDIEKAGQVHITFQNSGGDANGKDLWWHRLS